MLGRQSFGVGGGYSADRWSFISRPFSSCLELYTLCEGFQSGEGCKRL
jgi:hypothetical protein